MTTKKNKNNKYNKTQKFKNKTQKNNNSNKSCSKNFNTYETFEDKIEETFKKHKIDLTSTNYNLEKEIINNLKKAVSPSKIKPEDDFYSYINERWLKSYNAEQGQKYIAQFDDFRLVQDKVFIELQDIIDDYAKKNKDSNTPFDKCFITFYKSTMKTYNIKSYFINHLNYILKSLEDLYKSNSLWKFLAFINHNEIIYWGSPLVWLLNPDDKEPTIFRSYIGGPKLTLLDINVYFEDGTNVEYKRKYKNTYIVYLKKLFEYFFGKNNDYNVNDVFEVESKIANAFACNILKPKKEEPTYNRITSKEAIERFQFNWYQFSKELGFKSTPEFFITSDLNYLLCIVQLLLKEWNTPQWNTYWIYIYIRMLIRFDLKGSNIYFDFNGRFQQGIQSEIRYHLFRVFPFGFAFNTFLSDEYIKKYKNEENINYVKTMAKDLKTVFYRIIKRNKWLQPETKEKALKKLKKFNLEVGSPKNLSPDPILDYIENDIWGNLVMTCKWRHEKAIILEGKKIIDFPILDWSQVPPKFVSTQAYIVNAYYTPTKNGIYVPLGYIQKPFVDLDERGIEYNLAHIGFTLAHEMSHALDDWGSQYDENGKLNNWWTIKDKKIFKKIQEDIVKQYEVFASYDGIKFDAWPSIGEDLADI